MQIDLPVRFARKVTDSARDSHERNLDYKELRWNLSVGETALVLVDCWEHYPLESYQRRANKICGTKIKPVLETCREIGVAVVHAPSPQWAANYPTYHYKPELPNERSQQDQKPSGPVASADDWPPRSLTTEGEYALPRSEPVMNAWRNESNLDQLRIAGSVEPAGEDLVISTGTELHEFCREKRIKHLVYVGFATNFCVLFRDYGLHAMKQRGYNIIFIRDATTAVESRETVNHLGATRASVFYIEIVIGVSVTAETFVNACKNVTAIRTT